MNTSIINLSEKLIEQLKVSPEMFYNKAKQSEFLPFQTVVKSYLPSKGYIAILMPFINDFTDTISERDVRESFSTKKPNKYCAYVIFAALCQLLNSGIEINNLEDFPEFFQIEYLQRNR